ncbi:MAG: AbrB/MazE/SpoVT family DNA-binding domain-containing protein [Actinomycetota bacterium]
MPDSTVVRMGPQGRIVVPADIRRELGLDEGSTMAASAEDGRLVLEPRAVVSEGSVGASRKCRDRLGLQTS